MEFLRVQFLTIFFILMHDIDIGVESDVVSFEDDTRFYKKIWTRSISGLVITICLLTL